MDWDLAIKRNSKALKGIIEVLFALLGLDGPDAASRIPRSLHSAVLGVLWPAESALRRLIVIAARDVVVKLAPTRPMAEGLKIGKVGGNRPPSFQLFDPRKRAAPLRVRKFTRLVPRIHFFPHDPRISALFPTPRPVVEPPPPPDGRVSATRLHPQAQGPQIRTRRSAAPGQATRALPGKAEGLAKPENPGTAPVRPSSRLPPKAHSRGR